jgi:hypothetical protein
MIQDIDIYRSAKLQIDPHEDEAAIFARDVMRPATAAQGEIGRYAISGGAQWAWVLDTSTGRYHECDRDGKCSDWYSSK